MANDTVLSEADTIQSFLQKEHERFIKSILNLKYGYTFTALEKMVQADIPIILAAENIRPEEIEILKKIRKNICVIAINETWQMLLEYDLLPDFIMGDFLGNLEDCPDTVSVIADMETNNSALIYHRGKQFFYWTGNSFFKSLCEKAQEQSEALYKYNLMIQIPRIENVYERAVFIADYMNASKIILAGVDIDQAGNINNDKLLIHDGNSRELPGKIGVICSVECHIRETVDEMLPLLDDRGRKEFDNLVRKLGEEAKETLSYIDKNIDLYFQLYHYAEEGAADREVIKDFVDRISVCTEKIDRNKIIFCAMELVNKLDSVLPPVENAGNISNEIVTVAAKNIRVFENVRIVYKSFIKVLPEVISETGYEPEKENIKKHHTKILIVNASSQYHALPVFVEGLKRGFQRMGYDVYLRNPGGRNGIEGYLGYNIYQNTVGYDYIILMEGALIDAMFPDPVLGCYRFWYECNNTKTGAIFVDHPQFLTLSDRVRVCRDKIKIFLPDKYWCAHVQKYFTGELPCCLQMGGSKIESRVCFEQKENKIVFFGSKTDIVSIAKEINESQHRDVIWRMTEALIANPRYTVEEIILETGRKNGCLLSMEYLLLHTDIWEKINKYIRAWFREKVVMEIAKSGISFEVYGWKNEEIEKYENVILKEAVEYKEMLKICQNVRFVLNVQPWAKNGVQERVFNAMLAGSIAVTDVSEFLETEFRSDENILFYHLEEIEKLPEKIKYYMEHPEEAEKIAEHGYRIASEKHTWEDRAGEMMELWK